MRHRGIRVAGALGGSLLLVGCLTNTQTKNLQADVDDVQAQLLLLQKEHVEIRNLLAAQQDRIGEALERRDQNLRVDRADLLTQVDDLLRQMEVLGQKLEDSNYRISTLVAEVQATRSQLERSRPPMGVAVPGSASSAPEPPRDAVPAPADGPTPAGLRTPTAAESPEEIFNTAYADYTKGNYPLAILGFQEYLERYPDSAFADDALYWVGESYFSQGKFADAVEAFARVVREYPEGDKVPSAHLKRGLALLESNQTAQGVVQLNALIEGYPQSDEARIARDRLRSLGLRDR